MDLKMRTSWTNFFCYNVSNVSVFFWLCCYEAEGEGYLHVSNSLSEDCKSFPVLVLYLLLSNRKTILTVTLTCLHGRRLF